MSEDLLDRYAVAEARRRKDKIPSLEYSRQSVVDAVIDLGPKEATPERVASQTGYSIARVKRTMRSTVFRKQLKRRIVQRGFTADAQRELQNEIGRLVMKDIYRMVKNPDISLTPKTLLDIWKTSERISLDRFKGEALQKANRSDEERRVMNRKEAMERFNSNPYAQKWAAERGKKLAEKNGNGEPGKSK